MSALGRLAKVLDKQIAVLNDRVEAMRKGLIVTANNGNEDTAESIIRDVETMSQLMVVRSNLPHY